MPRYPDEPTVTIRITPERARELRQRIRPSMETDFTTAVEEFYQPRCPCGCGHTALEIRRALDAAVRHVDAIGRQQLLIGIVAYFRRNRNPPRQGGDTEESWPYSVPLIRAEFQRRLNASS